MEQFISLLQSFQGICAILNQCKKDEILSLSEEIFEKDANELNDLKIERLGVRRERVSYGDALDELKSSSFFLQEIYEFLYDDLSRETLYSLLKYWLLPDPFFLQEVAVEADLEETVEWKVLNSLDDLNQYGNDVKKAAPGQGFRMQPQDALSELGVGLKLLKFLRADLRFALRLFSVDKIELYAWIAYPKQGWKAKRVASIAKTEGEWFNVQLLKDNGLVPFLLHKNHGYRSTMVGVNNGDYPYLKEYVKGLEMEFLPDGNKETKYQWIRENAKDIDILIVNSVYELNMEISRIYKTINPKGVCYMSLDANSAWMDRIQFMNPDFSEMMDRIDVIGTSCRAMQRNLNDKWPWAIEFFPNGYYCPWIPEGEVPFYEKENIILTVGRLGTAQKATEILLEAFARIASKLPKWKLHLVGNVEPSFQGYVDLFFLRNPSLKKRVIFTGPISDKDKLFEEYKRAKVFALPSRFEGGTPNVVAEALRSGCAMAVTKFDAYEDAINDGHCGKAVPLNDLEGFSRILLEMCKDRDWLKKASHNAYEYAKMKYTMEKVVERIHENLWEAACIK